MELAGMPRGTDRTGLCSSSSKAGEAESLLGQNFRGVSSALHHEMKPRVSLPFLGGQAPFQGAWAALESWVFPAQIHSPSPSPSAPLAMLTPLQLLQPQ